MIAHTVVEDLRIRREDGVFTVDDTVGHFQLIHRVAMVPVKENSDGEVSIGTLEETIFIASDANRRFTIPKESNTDYLVLALRNTDLIVVTEMQDQPGHNQSDSQIRHPATSRDQLTPDEQNRVDRQLIADWLQDQNIAELEPIIYG